MCGIAGIFLYPDKSIDDLPGRLAAMAAAMQHRGPDDEGIYLSPDGRLGLANRRLAIRDLSPAGHMPMSNEDGSVWITYNGEIYNTQELRPELERLGYPFRSQSDTEVVLHGYEAWGEQVVERLRGMFALAIYDVQPFARRRAGSTTPDARRKTNSPHLFLARDHMGIKPLYYARTNDAFVFASELKTLLAAGLVGREISPAGLAGYLLMGSVPVPHTIYAGVTALEPASRLLIEVERPQAAQVESYWRLPADTLDPVSPDEAAEQSRALLAEAVRLRLVSDVPLGAFLSGGLDSSAVVALMRQATGGPIRTCSMVFAEAEYSEAPYARAMAEAVGAEHYERVVTAADLRAELSHILAAMDQPTVDGVNTYFVSQTARQAGLTVALSGVGGDELFGGYPNTFGGVPQMMRALSLAQAVPGGAAVAGAAIALLPNGARWAKVKDALTRPVTPASAYLTRRGLFSPSEVQSLVNPDIWQAAAQTFDPIAHITQQADAQSPIPDPHSSLFAWVSRAELRTYTHHQLLRDTDVMSMAHSLEVRVPLLDVKLVEYLLRLPPALKLNGQAGPKPLLRQALHGCLPDIVANRGGKQGFTFPFAHWLRREMAEEAQALLAEVIQRGWLQAGPARQTLTAFQAGRLHWSRPWALLALAAIVS
jgi:asparagine synthase (glutamine-hydrolysing)